MNKILTKEQIKENIIDYISSEHSNQISGFTDLTGYWRTKNDILKNTPIQNLEILYDVIVENFNSLEDVIDEFKIAIVEKLKSYPLKKAGRKSNYEKTLRRMKSRYVVHSKRCFDYIQRHKILAGLCVGKPINKDELELLVSNIELDEMSDNTVMETKLSNAMFRVELIHSFTIGTPFEYITLNKLKSISNKRLEYHQINLSNIESEFKNLFIMKNVIDKFKDEYNEAKKIEQELHKRLLDAENVYMNETHKSINNLSLSLIIKMKDYIKK